MRPPSPSSARWAPSSRSRVQSRWPRRSISGWSSVPRRSTQITFAKEQKALHTFWDTTAQDHTAETERKRWKAVVEREGRPDEWTKGQQYTRLWKEGVRPVYAPVLSEPEIKPEGIFTPEQVAQRVSAQADFMNQLQHAVPA